MAHIYKTLAELSQECKRVIEAAHTVEGFCVFDCYSTNEGDWYNQASQQWGMVIRDEADGLLHFVACAGEA